MHPKTLIGLMLIGCRAGAGLQAQSAQPVRLPVQYVENGYEFSGSIGNVIEFSDGTSLISDVKAEELRLLDWTTNAARLLGSRGRGPGEYLSVGDLYRTAGDSALLHQPSSRKMLVVTSNGLREAGAVDRALGAVLQGADQAGRLLMIAGFSFRRPGKPVSNTGSLAVAESMYVLLGDASGRRMDTVARVRGPTMREVRVTWWLNERDTTLGLMANPFAGSDAVSMYPDGWIALAHRSPYRVDWLTPANRWVRGPMIEASHLRVDARVKEESLRELKTAVHDISPKMFDDWPEWVPPFVGAAPALVQSHYGRLFVERTPATKPGWRLYDVINRRGQREAQLEMPRNLQLRYAGKFGLYVIHTDDDGLRHLRRYANPIQ